MASAAISLRKHSEVSVSNYSIDVSMCPVPSCGLVGEASILDGLVLILIVLNSHFGKYSPRKGVTLRVDSGFGVFSSERTDVIE